MEISGPNIIKSVKPALAAKFVLAFSMKGPGLSLPVRLFIENINNKWELKNHLSSIIFSGFTIKTKSIVEKNFLFFPMI